MMVPSVGIFSSYRMQCSFMLMQIEGELRNICNDVLDVLSKNLLPSAAMAEAKVFYSKMYAALLAVVLFVHLLPV